MLESPPSIRSKPYEAETLVTQAAPPAFLGLSVQLPTESVVHFDLDADQPQARVTLTLDNPSLMVAGKCRLNVLHHYRVSPARFLLSSYQVPRGMARHIQDLLLFFCLLATTKI